MAGAGTHYDVRTRFALTTRQRQVLDLVARGYTNAQIGEQLGITLDGAKWHVSEIIGKLGVSSREEAASYWIAYNRPASRFSRVLGGLAGVSLLRWAGVGFASVVIVGGVAAGFVLLDSGEDAAKGSQTPVADETPEGDADEPGVLSLIEGAGTSLPDGLAIYYYGGQVPLEGTPGTLLRAYRRGEEVIIDELYDELPDEGAPYTAAFDFERGSLVVGWCTRGYCGGHGEPSADAQTALYRSEDGGLTWSSAPALPVGTHLVGFAADGRLVATRPVSDDVWEYLVWPEGTILDALPTELDSRLRLVEWTSAEGQILDGEGGVLMDTPPLAASASYSGEWSSDIGVATWMPVPRDDPGVAFATELTGRDEGTLAAGRTVQWQGFDMSIVARIDADRVLARRYFPPAGGIGWAYVLNFADGTLREIEGLRRNGDTDSYPVGAVHGPFLRVVNSGTCLYVREQPSLEGEILYCYPDGVLLRDRGETVEADGNTWRAVVTPGGRYGWAAGDFLE